MYKFLIHNRGAGSQVFGESEGRMAEMVKLIEQNEFGDYLRQRQKDSGMTGEEFAATLGVNRITFSRLLNGHTYPSLEILNALNVRIAYVDDSQPAATAVKKAKAKKGTTDVHTGKR